MFDLDFTMTVDLTALFGRKSNENTESNKVVKAQESKRKTQITGKWEKSEQQQEEYNSRTTDQYLTSSSPCFPLLLTHT